MFKIEKGTNISHWLSQNNDRGQGRKDKFQIKDVKRLANLGLDHVRIPIDENHMWDDKGCRVAVAWDLLHEGISWCIDEQLRVVIDLHILRSHYFNAATGENTLFSTQAAVTQLTHLWEQLSDELKKYSTDSLAYEILNEPIAPKASDWNRVLRSPYEAIRKNEPSRMIAIGSNGWSSPSTFPDFDPPRDDPNLLLVVHFYEPHLITHYKAKWNKSISKYTGDIHYPGNILHENDIASMPNEIKVKLSHTISMWTAKPWRLS